MHSHINIHVRIHHMQVYMDIHTHTPYASMYGYTYTYTICKYIWIYIHIHHTQTNMNIHTHTPYTKQIWICIYHIYMHMSLLTSKGNRKKKQIYQLKDTYIGKANDRPLMLLSDRCEMLPE